MPATLLPAPQDFWTVRHLCHAFQVKKTVLHFVIYKNVEPYKAVSMLKFLQFTFVLSKLKVFQKEKSLKHVSSKQKNIRALTFYM